MVAPLPTAGCWAQNLSLQRTGLWDNKFDEASAGRDGLWRLGRADGGRLAGTRGMLMFKALQVLYPPDPPCEGPNHILKVDTTQCCTTPPLFRARCTTSASVRFGRQSGIIRRHRLANGKQVHFGILVELFALRHHAFQR